MEKETNINLHLELDTGIDNKPRTEISEEERQIARLNGRDIDGREKNNSTISGIANYRVIGGNQ